MDIIQANTLLRVQTHSGLTSFHVICFCKSICNALLLHCFVKMDLLFALVKLSWPGLTCVSSYGFHH